MHHQLGDVYFVEDAPVFRVLLCGFAKALDGLILLLDHVVVVELFNVLEVLSGNGEELLQLLKLILQLVNDSVESISHFVMGSHFDLGDLLVLLELALEVFLLSNKVLHCVVEPLFKGYFLSFLLLCQ